MHKLRIIEELNTWDCYGMDKLVTISCAVCDTAIAKMSISNKVHKDHGFRIGEYFYVVCWRPDCREKFMLTPLLWT